MAILFTAGLLLYLVVFLRSRSTKGAALSQVLWTEYFLLGVSGSLILVTGGIKTVYPPNYLSTLYLTACILLCVWAFRNVRIADVARLSVPEQVVRPIENFLIAVQSFSILFFLPFASEAVRGDSNVYRLELADTMETLAAFGAVNTVAGHASHLFTATLVLAFLRLSPTAESGRNVFRAVLLACASLSWIVYVLAYAGRDGVVYWGLTAAALYFLFRQRLASRDKALIARMAPVIGGAMLFPMVVITAARFFSGDSGGFWWQFEYFGAQIQNFSDYWSIDRPRTDGLRTFPFLYAPACELLSARCETWPDIAGDVFDEYLIQGKEPWLFGTFVSDFVGDFGHIGAFVLISFFAAATSVVCSSKRRGTNLTLSRLLVIILLFLVPFWGVFYFRFSIANGFLLVNAGLCLAVFVLERVFRANRRALSYR
jgi:oligosaccharide repeat unit polymerase